MRLGVSFNTVGDKEGGDDGTALINQGWKYKGLDARDVDKKTTRLTNALQKDMKMGQVSMLIVAQGRGAQMRLVAI